MYLDVLESLHHMTRVSVSSFQPTSRELNVRLPVCSSVKCLKVCQYFFFGGEMREINVNGMFVIAMERYVHSMNVQEHVSKSS